MKKKFLLAAVAAMLLLVSCGKNSVSSVNPASSDLPQNTSDSAISSESSVSESSSEYEEDDAEIGGGYAGCSEHTFSYHYIVVSLMDYVGQDLFDEWVNGFSNDEYGRIQEGVNIQSFIEHFSIPRDVFEDIINACADKVTEADPTEDRNEYLAEYGYTDEQIDALYSGDMAKVNKAFCGELAYYNPEDGNLYSIYWLSDHSAEDYEKAGLPETEVERILNLAEEEGGVYASFADKAVEKIKESDEIGGTYAPCEEHIGSYHYISTRLIEYVGWDAMNEWVDSDLSKDSFGRSQEDVNILSFIQKFDIPREFLEETIDKAANEEALANLQMTRQEFVEENGYTDEQIDALYSSDMAKVNKAFCGELAYYNPDDGNLYSIYWLSDHSAEDYEKAGLPEAEVERILNLAEEEGGVYASFADQAKEAAAEYAAID